MVSSTRPEISPAIAITPSAALTVISPVAVSSESNDSKVNLYTVAFAGAAVNSIAVANEAIMVVRVLCIMHLLSRSPVIFSY